jgi:acyl dehydratase
VEPQTFEPQTFEPQTFEPQTFRVTRADLVHYAGASGDFNPIHWSERIATSVGLPGVIAHGMFTMALVGRAVTAWAGAPDAVVEFSVRFSRPVPVPDTDEGTEVVVSATVKDAVKDAVKGVADDGNTRLSLTATCHGEKVLSLAQAVIRKR